MSYQVLARKYRPQTFEDIIGQAHVATTLANALRSGKVAHAYLFSGPRGVGKTTTARLLAKALNCEKGPTSTPCNSCDSCLRIAQGQEMVDVLEIDAASNRGIEEIRELRDNVRYAPARSRYKVYIVDEAHQITHDAFNAFLKTLEEPPPHAVFVLATTEHQKIPATILSRCQLFRFKRVSAEEITGRLEKILVSEKIKAEPAALMRLARAAGGSVRDALSLLDQALAYTPDQLTAKQVEMLLGFLPDEFLQGFASALLERKPAGVLEWTRQLADEGWELPQFVRDFREFLRRSLIEQMSKGTTPGVGASGVRGVGDTKGSDSLTLAGRSTTLSEVLQIIKVMGQCLDDMRWNDNPQLVLELYSLRLTQPFVDVGTLIRRIEQLENGTTATAGIGASGSRGIGVSELSKSLLQKTPSPDLASGEGRGEGKFAKPAPSSQPSPVLRTGEGARESETQFVPDVPSPSLPVSESPSTAPPVDTSALWKKLLAELWKKPSVAAQMERAVLKSSTGTEWVVAFADKFTLDSQQRSHQFIQESLTKLAGHPMRVKFVQESSKDSREAVATAIAKPTRPSESRADDPAIQKVLDVFKGRIRPTSPEGEDR